MITTTILVFLFGLVIGSFLNACIWRMANSKSVFRGRSMCITCKKTLHWYELIPLVSFVIQKGHCRGCKAKIDWQYPAVEFATGILFVLVYLMVAPEYMITDLHPLTSGLFPLWRVLLILFRDFYFVAVLEFLFVFDLRYGLLPDRVTIPAIVIAIFAAPLTVPDYNVNFIQNLVLYKSVFIGMGFAALGVAGFFALQFFMSKGKWVGGGDIRMGALMGVALGWPLAIVALALAYMIGGVFAGILLATRKKRFGQTVPMGPFLSAGTLLTLFFGHQIIAWYWNMI